MLLVLIASIVSAWILIHTTLIQNFLVTQVTRKLSHDLHTTVKIRHVNFELFNSMLLEGTLVQDQRKDTLLYAGSVKVNITDWFFIKDKIELKYIGLKDAKIHLNRSDSVWNYQFLLTYFSGPPNPDKKKNIDLNLSQVELDNIEIVQKDGWRGEDMRATIKALDIDAEEMNFNKKLFRIRTLHMDEPIFAIYDYDGNRPSPPDSIPVPVNEIINDPLHLRWNPDGWKISVTRVLIHDGKFLADHQTARAPYPTFDGAHILFGSITGTFNNLNLFNDTITADVSLQTRERSGFQVKQLSARLKMNPEEMEFNDLDLQTNRSHLHHYFAMRYSSFDDMNDFISKVRMEARFNDANISSDDIAFFAPELQTWKKNIVIRGTVTGSVDNLNGKKIMIQAGKDTYLKGNVSLAGLPDINKTYIDFEADDFKTTYKDAISFVPVLRKVDKPRLDLLEYLRFRGNFTGFFNDFVTYGSLETKLGTLITDLNMKLPDTGPSKYSGSINTPGFQLGPLIDSKAIGKLVFQGKVNGSGLTASTINAKLDGNIDLIEFNDYSYHAITIKGNVAKQLFNGQLTVNDPNLGAELNGLVDFSKKIPEFNFDANISRADLTKLNLMKEDVEFDGKFRFNFKGNNIDDFLGTARIYDASLFKSGKRISFDSLYLESKILDNNKVITAVSNEFDAAIAGEFSIKDLPASFQTFLNKYYPSYIKPSRKILTNENFSFVVTTKNVEEYINIIDSNLTGFNFSTVTGRINTRENLLDLNVEVPQFNYKNIAFYDVKLKATGLSDSLILESDISNVYIKDSLNFPNTRIKLRSANDMSDINIIASANQTLNSANISAQVQTLPKGARIKFRESTFDVNGKKWMIDKDGELLLTEDIVSADHIRMYSGLQEIHINSVPSNYGSGKEIRMDLQRVNIGDFSPYLVKSNRIEGLISGNINIADPFGKMRVLMNAETDQFRLDNDSIGKLTLKGSYYHLLKEVDFSAVSDNQNYNFDVKGFYQLGDSTKQENLDILTNLKNTRIDLLGQYLSGVFSDVTGSATGILRIKGPSNDLNYIGSVLLQDAEMRVKYTNVLYKIPFANVELKEDRIDFGTFDILDESGNKARISKSLLYHHSFDNLSFDFAMNTGKLLVLATKNNGVDPFYGRVVAKASMTFTGPLEDMNLDIVGEPADSSSLYINTKSGKQSGGTDFIVWKVYGHEMHQQRSLKGNNLTVNLDVNANNFVNMYVILDELTGDIIQANGHGNLKMRATTDGDFSITGRYDIDRGNYNFNFESLLRKPFRLREGVGNYIQWQGDPNKATIKIDAEYEAENVRFSDLGLAALTEISSNNAHFRGKVLVVASLSEQLSSPVIKFQIELPQNSPLKNDANAQFLLDWIQRDENEMNKQVAFLVVFNSFGPVSTSSQGALANTAFEGIVVGSISGVLSNTLSRHFSNVFQKVFNDKTILVNFNAQFYSGTNYLENLRSNVFNIDRTNLNLSVVKTLFDERLTFTLGSAVDFGLSSAQLSATKNLPFLPDISAEWKITPDGKLALTFFYRDSYNYQYPNSGSASSSSASINSGVRQNRTGASISYRRDYDTVGELLRGDKKKKKTLPPKYTKE